MKPGQIVADRYEIRGMLGRGGMGEVYLAHDRRLATDVALKRVPLELSLEPSIREALVQEARILARLSHSHVVRLFDLADTVDGMFLVLEYVCGPSFDKILRARPVLSPPEVTHVIDEVAAGLAVAHAKGVIHRDLKPSNLLVALEGDDQRRFLRDGTMPASLLKIHLKVTDFGLAKVIEGRSMVSGSVSGTPLYMAPEQFRGEAPSAETDIYALGLIAYQCLAGKPANGSAEPHYFHVYMTPAPLVGVPPHMNAVIQKALMKDRKDRYHSVEEFAAALRIPPKYRPQEAKPQPQPLPPKPKPKETPRWQVYLKALSIPLVLTGAVIGYQTIRDMRKPAPYVSEVKSDVAETAIELPVLPPLNPATRIDELPPVIESARLPKGWPSLPKGVGQAMPLGRVRTVGEDFFGFGPDGTLYTTSNKSNIGAVREGQLLWAFSLGDSASGFGISENGLIWIQSSQGGRTFCFNAAGQGGELTATARKNLGATKLPSDYVNPDIERGRCLDPDGQRDDPAIAGPLVQGKPAWTVKLDQRCKGDPMRDAGGRIVVQTEARTLYTIATDGRIDSTFAAPCILSGLMTLADGTAVGTCDGGKELLGIKNGRLAFSQKFEHQLTGNIVADREGGFYAMETAYIYNKKYLFKLNPAGVRQWRIEIPTSSWPKIVLSPDGRIYLLERNQRGGWATMVGERP